MGQHGMMLALKQKIIMAYFGSLQLNSYVDYTVPQVQSGTMNMVPSLLQTTSDTDV